MVVVVCIVSGSPGSGKSTLVRTLRCLVNSGSSQHLGAEGQCHVLELDDLLQQEPVSTCNSPAGSVVFDPQRWHSAWVTFKHMIAVAVRDSLESDVDKTYKVLFIVDVFHLESMIEQCRKICRECLADHIRACDGGCAVAFVHVALTTPLELCRARNADRDVSRRIPEDVLVKLHSQHQCAVAHTREQKWATGNVLEWEGNSLSDERCDELWNWVLSGDRQFIDITEPSPCVSAARSTSVIHQLDLLMRRVTHSILAAAKAVCSSAYCESSPMQRMLVEHQTINASAVSVEALAKQCVQMKKRVMSFVAVSSESCRPDAGDDELFLLCEIAVSRLSINGDVASNTLDDTVAQSVACAALRRILRQ